MLLTSRSSTRLRAEKTRPASLPFRQRGSISKDSRHELTWSTLMAWMRSTTRSTACELLFLRMQFPNFRSSRAATTPSMAGLPRQLSILCSRQGGVRTHGDLFGLLRSRHVSASNPFAGEPDAGDTNTQAGFTLGGSLRRTEIQYSVGSGSLPITPEQAQFIRGAPVSLGALYSAVADRAARTALFGNSPGGPRTFGLIPNLLPSSFRGLTTEAGNYKTTQDSYVHSSRLDHTFGTHGLFVRIGSSSSDTLGRASNSQIRRTQTLELTSSS